MSRYIDAEIPREKLCEWIHRTYIQTQGGQYDDGTGELIADCVNCIDETPTADVEKVRHGKWIMCDTNIQMAMILKCSECGRKIRVPLGNDYKKQYPYCHCGAKMDLK